MNNLTLISHEIARRIPQIHTDSAINNAAMIEGMVRPLLAAPESPVAVQVQAVETRLKLLEEIAGEVIGTCLVNLERGSLRTDDDDTFRRFLEVRMALAGLPSPPPAPPADGCNPHSIQSSHPG